MQTIRRLYLYAVTFVSLETVLWGSIGLIRSIVAGRDIGGGAEQLAGALSAVLVSVPVFLLHWWLAQREAAADVEQRSSRMRAVFLYGGLLATLVPVVQNFLALAGRILVTAFDLDASRALVGGYQSASDNLIAMLVNLAIAAYLYTVLRQDWKAGLQGDAYIETRRLYRYLWMLYGLAMVVFGAQQVLSYVFGAWAAIGLGIRSVLANGLALLITGTPVWVFAWRRILRSLDEPLEAQSSLRLGVLFLLSLAGAVMVLGSGSVVLYHILRLILGDGKTIPVFLGEISRSLSLALPFGALWGYYGRAFAQELKDMAAKAAKAAAHAGLEASTAAGLSETANAGRAAGVRRLYGYTLSLLGLGAVVAGMNLLLSFVLDASVPGSIFPESALRSNLAAGLSALLVGLPLWLLVWRKMTAEARRDDETGDHARRSLVRKTYLYLVLFVGVIGTMFSVAGVLFMLLNRLLGQVEERLLLDSLQLSKLAVLFALVLAYHWVALRADHRLAGRSLARKHAQYSVLVMAPSGGEFAEQMARALERESSELPVAYHDYSLGVPDESLSAAKAVILPSELVSRPSEALRLWLNGYTGERLVVPMQSSGWHWVAGVGRPLPQLARQAAQAVRHLAEGQEMPASQAPAGWMTVVYILAGLFGLQLLLGLLGLGISLFAN